jgi:hypothetical protein
MLCPAARTGDFGFFLAAFAAAAAAAAPGERTILFGCCFVRLRGGALFRIVTM